MKRLNVTFDDDTVEMLDRCVKQAVQPLFFDPLLRMAGAGF